MAARCAYWRTNILTLKRPEWARSVYLPKGLAFGIDVHETTFRVNVRWVTPLGEEIASTS
jgi:hypothetical protein